MAIRYTLVNTETGAPAATGFPTTAAQTTNFGFNVPGGPLESVIFRFTGTKNAAGDIDQDFAGAISSLRVIVNGETCFDHRSGYNDAGNDTTASQMGYFMNSIGNHLSNMVVASTTAVEAYFRVLWVASYQQVSLGSSTLWEPPLSVGLRPTPPSRYGASIIRRCRLEPPFAPPPALRLAGRGKRK